MTQTSGLSILEVTLQERMGGRRTRERKGAIRCMHSFQPCPEPAAIDIAIQQRDALAYEDTQACTHLISFDR